MTLIIATRLSLTLLLRAARQTPTWETQWVRARAAQAFCVQYLTRAGPPHLTKTWQTSQDSAGPVLSLLSNTCPTRSTFITEWMQRLQNNGIKNRIKLRNSFKRTILRRINCRINPEMLWSNPHSSRKHHLCKSTEEFTCYSVYLIPCLVYIHITGYE